MQKSSVETTLLYLGFACIAASLFHQSLHLPPWTEMLFSGAGIMCFIGVFAARRRRRNRTEDAAGSPPRSPSVALRLWMLFLIIATSASAPWWLPHTGVTLDFAHRVVVAIITCVVGVAIFLFAQW